MGGNSTSNGNAYGITKNGRNSGTLLHSTCLVFFPKFSITILWPRRRRKIIQTVSLLRMSQEKKWFEMDGVSLRKPSAECKVPKKDETIHIIRDWKQKKRLKKLTCLYSPWMSGNIFENSLELKFLSWMKTRHNKAVERSDAYRQKRRRVP